MPLRPSGRVFHVRGALCFDTAASLSDQIPTKRRIVPWRQKAAAELARLPEREHRRETKRAVLSPVAAMAAVRGPLLKPGGTVAEKKAAMRAKSMAVTA
jgi:hypothetical protein